MDLDAYLPELEEEAGTIFETENWDLGIHYLCASEAGPPWEEYLVVLDNSPIAAKVQNYGKKMDGLRLFAMADDSSGWRIVQYESSKYGITSKGKSTPEWFFRDMTLHAMELHPDYFGTFPVPFHTPCGYTLLHRTLANGIYWLETSMCQELLAVSFPIWNAELSPVAVSACKLMPQDIEAGVKESTCYLFFPKDASCIPIYELMETRRAWEGTVIDRPALMNAIWEFMPQYAMHLNGQEDAACTAIDAGFLESTRIDPFPEPHRDRMVYMYPDAGTDFLLLK